MDGHADFVKHEGRSVLKNFISQKILHGIYYKRLAKSIENEAEVFYGVLPIRVSFLIKFMV